MADIIQTHYVHTNNGVTIIHGGPISNTWYYAFDYKGFTFQSAFQAIVYCHARALERDDLAKTSLVVTDLESLQSVSQQLYAIDQSKWTEVEDDTLLGILKAKFSSPYMMKQLQAIEGDFITAFSNDPYSLPGEFFKNTFLDSADIKSDKMGQWLKSIRDHVNE
uniref:hypothetical protein n=1 Tax=Streptococcus pluranimalium TaxID=82348 RepID=UPI003F6945B7